MRVYLQPTRSLPSDWQPHDLTSRNDWRAVVRGYEARPPSAPFQQFVTPDDVYLFDMSYQGMEMGGADHYALEFPGDGSLVVTRWNDDPVDWLGDFWAQRWTMHPPALSARVGKLQQRWSLDYYAEASARRSIRIGKGTGSVEFVTINTVSPYSDFVAPDPRDTVHGIWVDDALHAAHVAARTLRGWARWLRGE